MSITFTPIVPPNLNEDVFYDLLQEAVEETIDEADDQFGRTYATWRHDPGFEKDIDVGRDKIRGSTSTDDPVYRYLSKGTAVRYATMTPDFEAKTRPRFLGSSPGRGGVAYIDRRRPRPGIEARQFEEAVKERVEPKFRKRGQQKLNEAAKKCGHGA